MRLKEERITYIDTAKGIAILLVLLGHILIFSNEMGYPHLNTLAIIYTFHMPCFFIISGVMFNTKKWLKKSSLEFIKSRIKSLLIPYLFLDLTGGIYIMLLKDSISFNYTLEIFKNTFSFYPNVGPNWFLPALFISNILFYYCVKHYKDWYKYIIFLPILVLGLNIIKLNPFYIFIFRIFIGFTFMFIGYKLKSYFQDDYNKRYDVLIVTLVLLITLKNWNNIIDIWSCSINNPIFMILGGVVGTFFVFGISKHIDNKLLQFLGKNTITFMATHFILIEPLYNLLKLSGDIKSILLLFSVIVVIEILIIHIYNRCFPKLIGKNK